MFELFDYSFFDYLFIIGIIIIGLITSYTDIRYGKIRNKILFIGIIYSIILNVFLFSSLNNINYGAYIHYFTNAFFMLVLGFIFWNIGLWTAGDAKLFFVLNLLTLPNFITNYYLGYFYGLVYFINIFGIILIYFIYKIFTKIKKFELIFVFKKTFTFKLFFSIFSFLFSFSFLFKYFPRAISMNFFAMVILFYVFYSALELLFKKKSGYIVYVVAIIRIILDFKSLLSFNFWSSILLYSLSIHFFVFFVVRLSYYAFTKKILISDLKKGMFLAEDIIPIQILEQNEERKKMMQLEKDSGLRYSKLKIEQLTLFAYLKSEFFKHIPYEKTLGLSVENVDWFNSNKSKFLFKSIRVYDTMPFAPLIVIGVLLTILFKGNLFIVMRDLIINIK